MSKYIRTKDGRILKSFRDEMSTLELETLIAQKIMMPNDEIISQADTIEELCDEFVYEKNIYKLETRIDGTRYLDRYHFGGYDNHMIYDLDKSKIKCLNEIIPEVRKRVYGAIWTDKGLIYVAKMNDKGELELL